MENEAQIKWFCRVRIHVIMMVLTDLIGHQVQLGSSFYHFIGMRMSDGAGIESGGIWP